VKIVLTSMMFNLGKNRFLTFKKFIRAIKEKDYKKAIIELFNSRRAKQLPNRTELEAQYLKKLIKG
jgi:lysozyme